MRYTNVFDDDDEASVAWSPVMLTRTQVTRPRPRPRTQVARPTPRPRTQVARPTPRPRTWQKYQGQGQGLDLSDQGQGQGHCDYNDQGHGQGLYDELKLIENDILIITGKVKIIYFKVVSYKH